jgi:hypothetical protein
MASPYKIIPFVAFLIVANPATYKAVRSVAGNWVASSDGLATTAGLFLHAFVFVLLTSFLMKIFVPRKSGFSLSMAPVDDDMTMAPVFMDEAESAMGGVPAPAPSPAKKLLSKLF